MWVICGGSTPEGVPVWEVGFYPPTEGSSYFLPIAVFPTKTAAALAVHWLNGGSLEHANGHDFGLLIDSGLVS